MGFRAHESMHMIRNAYRLSLKSKMKQYIQNFWLLIIVTKIQTKITLDGIEVAFDFFVFCFTCNIKDKCL